MLIFWNETIAPKTCHAICDPPFSFCIETPCSNLRASFPFSAFSGSTLLSSPFLAAIGSAIPMMVPDSALGKGGAGLDADALKKAKQAMKAPRREILSWNLKRRKSCASHCNEKYVRWIMAELHQGDHWEHHWKGAVGCLLKCFVTEVTPTESLVSHVCSFVCGWIVCCLFFHPCPCFCFSNFWCDKLFPPVAQHIPSFPALAAPDAWEVSSVVTDVWSLDTAAFMTSLS